MMCQYRDPLWEARFSGRARGTATIRELWQLLVEVVAIAGAMAESVRWAVGHDRISYPFLRKLHTQPLRVPALANGSELKWRLEP